ncbi:alpha-1,3-mannosyl-glycoprotein 4-beta-N-acetylglucosaminyltransferase C-like isoform X1 [Mya arenaria]|uniref:alpha-1,3-mannosyl-glycoprotein 4-beta-N-acetylglucosaminyltransferase C-like isoform X1 n=1 Tax=Mya arenaria TaxID=6604 RepID=UPI0022E71A7D|nr:alpha-1,3-mannosyl-glycoprotein 4-beta-N-acetylglucosaminyltransferase C-like isoform X1 [Mya arenaria]
MLCGSLLRKFCGRIGRAVTILLLCCLATKLTFLFVTKGIAQPNSQRPLCTNSVNAFDRPMMTEPTSSRKSKDGVISKTPFQVLMYGTPRKQRGLFTIGIPSAKRPNTDRVYLIDTVDSIVNKTTDAEKKEVTVVIMLCDLNSTFNEHISERVFNRYKPHVESGFIQIIHAEKSIYPDLEHVKQTFGDAKDRLKWRAKQNVDFAFLMHYCINISDYYLQLEDDVIAASNFVNGIKSYLSMPTPWALLEFSRLGFIGKMFKSVDLEYVASTLLLKYDEAPCDLLLGPIRIDLGQMKPFHSEQSFFQHIGRFSSLKNKLMPKTDNKFKDSFYLHGYPPADYPEATFETTFQTYLNFAPKLAYDKKASTYFWGETPKMGDTFTVILAEPQNLTRIVVLTGKKETRADNLLYTDLECSTSHGGSLKRGECGTKFKKMTSLVDGDADTLVTGTAIPSNVKCLKLAVKRSLKTWVAIREFLLYT